MLVNRNRYGFSSNKKHVIGTGFVDSLSSIINSIKASAASAAPIFKSVGNYVVDNKDLIAKPVLGAIGSLAAAELSAGIPAIISHIAKRNRIKNNADQGFNGNKQQWFNGSSGQQEVLSENLEPKYKEILQNIVKSKNNNSSNSSSNNMQNPLTNIIGSGIKSF
jgi:hypothetical protein